MIWFDRGVYLASFMGHVAKRTFSSRAAAMAWIAGCEAVGGYRL